MTTPDNAIYYQLAYVAAAVIYVGYALSIVVRRRRLRARMDALTQGERT
jgi:hypothetical protein